MINPPRGWAPRRRCDRRRCRRRGRPWSRHGPGFDGAAGRGPRAADQRHRPPRRRPLRLDRSREAAWASRSARPQRRPPPPPDGPLPGGLPGASAPPAGGARPPAAPAAAAPAPDAPAPVATICAAAAPAMAMPPTIRPVPTGGARAQLRRARHQARGNARTKDRQAQERQGGRCDARTFFKGSAGRSKRWGGGG